MESTTVKLYSLNYGNVRTYLAASLFIVGNILFPQFFHLIPQGGITWLPIYSFSRFLLLIPLFRSVNSRILFFILTTDFACTLSLHFPLYL